MLFYFFGMAVFSISTPLTNSEYIYDKDRIFHALSLAYPKIVSVETFVESVDTNIDILTNSDTLVSDTDIKNSSNSSTNNRSSNQLHTNDIVVESHLSVFTTQTDNVFVVTNISVVSNYQTRLNVRGQEYYWFNNRILPKSEFENWKQYGVVQFYLYPKEVRNPKEYTKEQIKQFRTRASKNFRKHRKAEAPFLFDNLYGIRSSTDTNVQITNIRFLNFSVNVHSCLVKPLEKVQAELLSLSNTAEVAEFLKSVDTMYSFFWRNIAGSNARSFHSYGLAIDVLDSRSKLSYYWLWRQDQKIDWLKEPISVRWNISNGIVKIFEKYGFVWGGKWIFYDTMHFEYRPELLILNGYDVKLVN
ncbi:MAG: M15 family metallopeptidase [Brevinemataceae bacterium]